MIAHDSQDKKNGI